MRTCSACSGLTPTGDLCLHCDAPLPARGPSWPLRLAAVGGSMLLAACYGPSGEYRRQHQMDNQGSAAEPAQPAPPPPPADAAPTSGSAAPVRPALPG